MNEIDSRLSSKLNLFLDLLLFQVITLVLFYGIALIVQRVRSKTLGDLPDNFPFFAMSSGFVIWVLLRNLLR